MIIALGWWIQLDTEGRQALAGPDVSHPCVAVVVAKFEQILRIEATAELVCQVSGVFGAGVEGEQAVQVRKHRRAQVARTLHIGQPVEPRQGLRRQEYIGAVFGEDRKST